MKNIVRIAIACFLSFLQYQTFSQTITREKSRADLKTLQQGIKEFNPALPHYHPEFDSLSESLIQSITKDSLSIFEHFTLVCKMSALSNEGHFGLGSWEDAVHKGIVENTFAYLPLTVIVAGGQLYVKGDYSNEQVLRPGDRIVSINNRPMKQILDILLECTPSDGYIKTYALHQIQNSFRWLYFYHVEQSETFEIVLMDSNEGMDTVKISALIRSDQLKNAETLSPGFTKVEEKMDGFFSLKYANDHSVLTLPSFDFRRVQKYEVKSDKMYETIFKELKNRNVRKLVIDLRGNTGGRNEFSDDIVPFLLSSKNLDPYFKKTISWKGKEKKYKMPSPSKYAYTGEIYVLIDGLTFSAGSSLARYLKEYGNATIIGEESGTRYEGFAAGSSQHIILPHSQLNIGIPRYHIVYPTSEKQQTINRGVLPDYLIQYTIEDILTSRDLCMEKVIELMTSEK